MMRHMDTLEAIFHSMNEPSFYMTMYEMHVDTPLLRSDAPLTKKFKPRVIESLIQDEKPKLRSRGTDESSVDTSLWRRFDHHKGEVEKKEADPRKHYYLSGREAQPNDLNVKPKRPKWCKPS